MADIADNDYTAICVSKAVTELGLQPSSSLYTSNASYLSSLCVVMTAGKQLFKKIVVKQQC